MAMLPSADLYVGASVSCISDFKSKPGSSDRRDTMNAWNPRVCQTNPQVPVDCASLHQRDGHLCRAGVASRQHLHAFLLPEIAREPLAVGNAMPRFDANKVRSRFRPNAKVGCIRK